ncbi:MAG: DUF1585 domain-containing protein [Deltaproteobacteria bacterium]|nr:DUF1585 domain-containing protein [Deltaproteobacteria bacterium]
MGAVCIPLAWSAPAQAQRTLEEFRHFRALSIDLQGRIPTREELSAFERPEFNLERWVDEHLGTDAYAERLRRIYIDRLRLQVGTAFPFRPAAMVLRRIQVQTARGPVWVYFRRGQRRANAAIDGDLCFTPTETGMQFPANGAVNPSCNTPQVIPDALLNERTVSVRPWWLYRDYRSATPRNRYSSGEWASAVPGYQLVPAMDFELDGTTPVAEVRVCREETGSAAQGRALVRTTPLPPRGTGCAARVTGIPNTNAQAMRLGGRMVGCDTGTGFSLSAECGCGPGLERCLPGAGMNSLNGGPLFTGVGRAPLGSAQPLEARNIAPDEWNRYWWSQEAVRFLDGILREDRDFRDVVRARDTYVNGPLAQFYRVSASDTCCNSNHLAFNYVEPTGLFDPDRVPAAILPHDVNQWTRVPDRGPGAAGILTMPVFLTKYGTRRARAHVLYQTFLCREFVAENVMLRPSTEPNLMVREGCAACHATLEPLAAYFTRVTENDWTLLPRGNFPLDNPMCGSATPERAMPAGCAPFYDPAFTTAARSQLRGAYGSVANAEAGPAGLGAHLSGRPEFAACMVENVTESFLGREFSDEDAALRTALTQAVTAGGFRMRALVRAIVLSDLYRRSNNLTPTAWRQGGAP